MTPWQYVKAVGLLTGNILFCAAFAVIEALAGAWWLMAIFLAIGAYCVWQWPRSLRSYRRLVEAERRLGASRALFIKTAIRKGIPPEVIVQLDGMIQDGASAEDVLAIIAEHRPH